MPKQDQGPRIITHTQAQKTFYDQRFKKIATPVMEQNVRDFYFRKIVELLEGNLDPSRQIDCLEIGVGEGMLMQRLTGYFGKFRFRGIDISEKNIINAREKGLNVSVMDAQNMIFDRKFDLIYGTAILHHLDKLDAFFDQLAGILKPRGMILFGAEPDYCQITYILYHMLRGSWDVEKGMLNISAKKMRKYLNEKYTGIRLVRHGNCFVYCFKKFGKIWNSLLLSRLPFFNDLYIIARKK